MCYYFLNLINFLVDCWMSYWVNYKQSIMDTLIDVTSPVCSFSYIISTLISYITYSQVWVIQENQRIFVGGNTTRATFEFELEFFKFLK